ncbi:MAG: Gfo/Idh/MocA family oxidoreductase [Rhodothermales bacterium]
MSSSRRDFLKTGALLSAGSPLIVNPAVWSSTPRVRPSDRITIGVIGYGRRARSLVNRLIGFDDTQIVAVCDVADVRIEDGVRQVNEYYTENGAGNYGGCDAYTDFRDIISRDDIDAVVIATPDHWHAIPAVRAAEAGKHIYCEKPMVHTVVEGRKVADAVAANGVTFQTGSQQRSEYDGKFRLACELIRNERIGRLHTIRVGIGVPPVPCDLPAEPLPDGIDWDMWLGPAPYRRYSSVLCPDDVHGHFPDWRDYIEYANGMVGDFGAHHYDIAQWAMGMDDSGPVEVHPPMGGLNGGLMFRYANGVMMYHGGRSGITFYGDEGELHVDRGTLEATPSEILDEPIGSSEIRLEDPGVNHQRNWIDCIKSGERPLTDAEVGHRTNTVCQLTTIGYNVRRPLRWDPVAETFEDDEEANGWLHKELRDPWVL